jgi:acyl carrier protein
MAALAHRFLELLRLLVAAPDQPMGTGTIPAVDPSGGMGPVEDTTREPEQPSRDGQRTKMVSIAGDMLKVRVFEERRPDTEPILWPCVGDYGIYDDVLYYIMTNDEPRNRRYREAARKLAPGALPNSDMTDTNGTQIETWVKEQLARHLGLSPEEIDANESPFRYGADSLTLVTIAGDLEVWLGRPLEPGILWEYPTISSLATALAGDTTPNPPTASGPDAYGSK